MVISKDFETFIGWIFKPALLCYAVKWQISAQIEAVRVIFPVRRSQDPHTEAISVNYSCSSEDVCILARSVALLKNFETFIG